MAVDELAPSSRGVLRLGVALAVLSLVVVIGSVMYAARAERKFAQQALALRTISPDAVARAARVLKLVTIEVTDVVRLKEADRSSFRPDVEAAVELPVRLSFGLDLSAMDATWVRVQTPGLSGVQTTRPIVVVRVPRPTRLAAEPITKDERATVTRSLLRFGEEAFLDKLRLQASQAANQLELGPKEQARVEEMTKAQLQTLLRAILRDEADIVVEYAD